MYRAEEFLEQYKSLERWAIDQYDEDGVKSIEQLHPDKHIQNEVRYFRNVRNILTHNPNGSNNSLIELTDEFKVKFESLCNNLMEDASQVAIPFKEIFKREMSDKVLPTIKVMKERTFTHVPIMNGRKVWGVFSESTVFDIVSGEERDLIQKDTSMLHISKYITKYSSDGVFDFARKDASIDDIRRMFADAIDRRRRLDVVFITSTGDMKGDLIGLITVWDISTLS